MTDDIAAALHALAQRVWILENRNPLENAAVDKGGVYINSTEGLTVNGSAVVVGLLDGTGTLVWSGPWELSGAGDISGDVDLSGDLNLTGKITTGDVRIENGKIHVGDMVLDPSDHDGMITMPNGGQILAFGSGVEIYSAGPVRRGLVAASDKVAFAGLPVGSPADIDYYIGESLTNGLFRIPKDAGGPGRVLVWPFPSSTVTSEYGPRDLPPPASAFHEGIDFGIAEGTPIPAAGSGVVTIAGFHSGFGNYVVIDHGGGLETLYAHMQYAPSVSVDDHVARNQTLGLIGSTGASLGPHLHFEVHVDGVPVNPRTKLPTA